MIGLIATLVEALVLRNYFLFAGALAVLLISLKSRDLGLVGYFVYVLYFAQRVQVTSIYSYNELTTALTFGLAMLLFLEDVLRGKLQIDRAEIVPSILILGGVFIPEAMIAGELLYLAVMIPSLWGALFGGVAIGLMIILKSTLEGLGTSGQVTIISAIALGAVAVAYALNGPSEGKMFSPK
ncbi:hypothetical protein [Thermococcus sp.]|uniref:hypothetical protein n=1 Tax=Thermococcus sp. TaxID=35749 RepID=UPI002614EB60|nr:hypothetical protein [Thermococcus sp.]